MAGLGAAGAPSSGIGGGAELGENVLRHAGGIFGPLARGQYAALTRLRWRMFTNGLRSNAGALELGARTFSFIVYALMGLAFGSGAGAATYLIASRGEWRLLPIVFWVLAFVWQMVPVMLASFQEQFDLGILLRFPVRFGSYMLLYLVFGLVDISTILGGLCCMGIWFGVAAARPDVLPWITLALAVFAVFNILLVRAVFAWIERWLAQRKTREILGAVFMVAILGLQLLNPAIYHRGHSDRRGRQYQADQFEAVKARYEPWLRSADAVQQWLPPGLAAQSLQLAVAQKPAAGLGSLGVLGLYGLFVAGVLAVRLKAEYRGENLGVAPGRTLATGGRAKAALSPDSGKAIDLDRGAARAIAVPNIAGPKIAAQLATQPFIGSSGPMAAVIEKDLRALIRTLPLLYAIGAPLLLVLVFSTIFIKNGAVQSPVFPLAFPICMVYAQLGFTQVFYNSLGTEGAGVQLYFLSPTPFRTVLMAKNALHSLLFAIVALVAAVLASLRLGIPDGAVWAATGAWLLFSLPCNLAAGNIFSMRMPYRVNPGRIARQRGSQANAFLSLLVQLGILAVAAAVFALSWFLGRLWLAVPIFLVLAVGAVFVWTRVLSNSDSMANERRDTLIATLMKPS
jgi:ABC-2 type transport system permease protein